MDVQEFQRLYQEKFGLIYGYVFRKVGNREDAEDLTSEIFLKAVSTLNQEFSPQSIHKWLFLIARSIVADYWRTHYRHPANSLDELLEAGWEGSAEEESAVAANHKDKAAQMSNVSKDRIDCLPPCERQCYE
jgi:RNA polymerase sigma-70 factor, ECF subfamily